MHNHNASIPEKIYEGLSTKGLYEEANLDMDEVEKVKNQAIEDYAFGKSLRNIKSPSYRVIFNLNYDVLRELCDALMRFKKQKISNHQGLFAFIMLNFPELEFDLNFLDDLRNVRNLNKYKGADVTK